LIRGTLLAVCTRTGARSWCSLRQRGNTRYRELNARFLAIASTLGVGLSEGDVRRTRDIVQRLSDEVKRRSDRPPQGVTPSPSGVNAGRAMPSSAHNSLVSAAMSSIVPSHRPHDDGDTPGADRRRIAYETRRPCVNSTIRWQRPIGRPYT